MHQSALLSEVAAGRELARLSSKQSQSENAVETAADPEAKDLGQEAGSPVSPLNIVEEQRPKERWNDPAINVWRVVCSFYGMMLIGFHDGIIGAVLPYVETYYGINYTIVSLIFVMPILGYGSSGIFLNLLHEKFGLRGIAIIGASTRLVAYVVICVHPPYPLVVCAYALTGFGNGVEDAAWNAWIGNLRNENEVMGFLHGAYGLGGIFGPLVATALITRYELPWWTPYYVMVGMFALELATSPFAFWSADGRTYRTQHQHANADSRSKGNTLAAAARHRVVWIAAVFLFIYVGTEVSITGWVNTFLQTVRHAPPFMAGLSTTMFWTGATVGRIGLGFVNGRIGEKLAVFIYLILAVGFHLVLFFVPSIEADLAAVAIEGFFLGPLFPAAVVAATKLLPPYLHVSGVGIAVNCSAIGSCVLPFVVGAIAQAKGVQVLMPSVLAFLGAGALVWALLPSLKRHKNE